MADETTLPEETPGPVVGGGGEITFPPENPYTPPPPAEETPDPEEEGEIIIPPPPVVPVPQVPDNMKYYVIYTVATGEIRMVVGSLIGMAEDELAVNTGPGQAWVQAPTPPVTVPPTPVTPPRNETHYVLNGVVVLRKLFTEDFAWSKTTIAANNVDTAVIGPGLPNPTRVSINPLSGPNQFLAQSGNISDGSMNFASSVPGDYAITLEAFPYAPYTQIIKVT